MSAYKFFSIVISLLAYSSLCLGQNGNPCFPNGQVNEGDCDRAFALMNFTTDRTVLSGEKKISAAYGGCLLEVISKNKGTIPRLDIFGAILDIEDRCTPALVCTFIT
ncbi:hypothetical protein PGT21_021120 [Puccinia graminis f. sp. tritici]|uniref:Uncharacterized protein n=1 Tax=Puccinia graminis f. sp. tritici TaxID=56615 RepID=A0A5B0N2W2_PUCGR|nr:hypothetical protein PGT21_021120 [Puccinia graminis f. sp. tritici]KAA1124124.1 hypothetical protein PGTUg99_028627 [Puccinia graminis f. sp. tritici]